MPNKKSRAEQTNAKDGWMDGWAYVSSVDQKKI